MKIEEIGPFLEYFEGFRRRTVRVARLVPEGRLEWRLREGAWSVGDIVRHLAGAERWMFTENACLRPSRYPGHGVELAGSREEVFAYLDELHVESRRILGALEPSDLRRKCRTPAGNEITVWKWLRAMIEHEAHHRGQIYWIVSSLGVEAPPLFGLTEEEVRARSGSEEDRV